MSVIASKDTLSGLWNQNPRQVELPMMIATAEMESGAGLGIYDAVAERYEQALHEKQGGDKSLYISYGLFQIMGFNLTNMGGFDNWLELHDEVKGGNQDRLEEYVGIQIDYYDKFMGALLQNHDIPTAFERYNGSGPAARAYRDKAMTIYQRESAVADPA
jgi:hypothetical protein